MYLAHHSKPVLLVVFLSYRVHGSSRLESAHREFRRGLFKAGSEYGQRSAAVLEGLLQGVDQTVQQGALGSVDLIFRGLLGHNARPLFGLRCLQPCEYVLRDEGAFLVVAGELLFVEPTVGTEIFTNLGFKALFVLNTHKWFPIPQSGRLLRP